MQHQLLLAVGTGICAAYSAQRASPTSAARHCLKAYYYYDNAAAAVALNKPESGQPPGLNSTAVAPLPVDS